MDRRNLWLNDLSERGVITIDDARIFIENLYREFGCYDKPHEEAGCPNCKTRLFDRLTLVKIYKDNPDIDVYVHLNSGPNLEDLQRLRVQEINGINLYFKDGKLVTEQNK